VHLVGYLYEDGSSVVTAGNSIEPAPLAISYGSIPHIVVRNSLVGIVTHYVLHGPGIRIPVGARFFALVQTGPGVHPAYCTMGTGSLSRG
jgi:hypothetical protein